MIKTVIIDDNAGIRSINKCLLAEYFPEVSVLGEADSVESAFLLIKEVQPDLVLLDIEIKGGTGFQLLQKLRPYSFMIVFITAFNDYALKAIKFHAIDYVLKPVNAVEFEQAIQSAIDLIKNKELFQEQSNLLLQDIQQPNAQKKIIIRTTEALHLLTIADILFAKSDNSYTTFYMIDGEEIMVAKGIAFYEELLSDSGFLRPHQSYLVNLQHIKKLDKSDGGFIILNSKHEIPVSNRRKKALIDLLEKV